MQNICDSSLLTIAKSYQKSTSAVSDHPYLQSSSTLVDCISNNRPHSFEIKNGVATSTEAHFILVLGMLLSLNSGYINGLCLGGLLSEHGSRKQGVSAVTAMYTESGLALANGDSNLFGFELSLLLAFIGGACLAGAMNPKAASHALVPSYGPTFLIGSVSIFVASVAAEFDPNGRTLYYFAAIANGLQNGITSTYTANLIRTSHLTGTSTDIGLIVGQMLQGNWTNYWKLKILVGLATSFWFGSFISFWAAKEFLSQSLWFSAALYLMIGSGHLLFVTSTKRKWEWDKVVAISTTTLDKEFGEDSFHTLSTGQVDDLLNHTDEDHGLRSINIDV